MKQNQERNILLFRIEGHHAICLKTVENLEFVAYKFLDLTDQMSSWFEFLDADLIHVTISS